MRTLLWGACALGLVACGGSGGVDIDGGDDSGTSPDAAPPADAGPSDATPSDGSPSGDASDAADAATFGGRLFVSQQQAGVAVWDGATSLAADGAPTFTMSDTSVSKGTRGALAVGARLVLGPAAGGLVVFDAARTFGANAAPSAAIPVSAFIKPTTNISEPQSTLIAYNEKTDTLWAGGTWGMDRFDDGATLSSSSTGAALFSHAYLQLPGFAYDGTGDHAILGQISGAGVLEWDGAKSATGTPTASFTLDQKLAAWSLAVSGDRLYAIGGDTTGGATPRESIDVWNGISSVSAAKAPDFSITSGIAQNDFSPYVTVAADVLIACIQANEVLMWKNASTLTTDKAPDFTLTTQLSSPTKAVLAPVSNRLYVLDSEGVAIYANATSAPTFVAKIKTGLSHPEDLVVIE